MGFFDCLILIVWGIFLMMKKKKKGYCICKERKCLYFKIILYNEMLAFPLFPHNTDREWKWANSLGHFAVRMVNCHFHYRTW